MPLSSLPFRAARLSDPADYAVTIAATGSNAMQNERFAFPPVVLTAPFGVFKAAKALTAAS